MRWNVRHFSQYSGPGRNSVFLLWAGLLCIDLILWGPTLASGSRKVWWQKTWIWTRTCPRAMKQSEFTCVCIPIPTFVGLHRMLKDFGVVFFCSALHLIVSLSRLLFVSTTSKFICCTCLDNITTVYFFLCALWQHFYSPDNFYYTTVVLLKAPPLHRCSPWHVDCECSCEAGGRWDRSKARNTECRETADTAIFFFGQLPSPFIRGQIGRSPSLSPLHSPSPT